MSLRRNLSSAFTLVELLVVVSIIALLIALLIPQMNRAKYTAKVTACGATLKGMGRALLTYTTDYRGYYPAAAEPPQGAANWTETIWQRSWEWSKRTNPSIYDLRPVYRDYLGGALDKTAKCPMAAEYFAERKLDDQWLSNYHLYATNNHLNKNFYYDAADAPIVSIRMNRTWSLAGADRDYEFAVLASDTVFGTTWSYGGARSGHPAPNGFDRYAGGPINDFPAYGIGFADNPIYETVNNFLDNDGSVSQFKVRGDSYLDANTWAITPNNLGMLPKALAK